MAVTASSLRPILPALTWPENLAASLTPAAWLGMASTWFLAFLVHALHTLPSPTATVGGVAPRALVFAKQLAVSRLV